MRGDRFTRQLRLLQLLENRPSGLELDEAAALLGRGRRTVYRDFEVLEQSGIPLMADREGRRARWRMMEGYRHRLQLSLSWSEVLALSTGARLMEGLAGTVFHEGALSALEKIRATLPKALSIRTLAAEAGISAAAGGHDYRTRGVLLKALLEAIEERRTISCRYRSRSRGGEGRERKLDPLHLRVTGESIYLIARSHERGDQRTFLLDRFDWVKPTGERFEAPRDFRAQDFLAPSFGMWAGRPRRVSFVAAPEMAAMFLERKVHPSQVVQRRSDGAAEVRLNVAIGPPLVAFLAGMGAEVSAVEPSELAERLRALHQRAIEASSGPRRPQRVRREKKRPAAGRVSLGVTGGG